MSTFKSSEAQRIMDGQTDKESKKDDESIDKLLNLILKNI